MVSHESILEPSFEFTKYVHYNNENRHSNTFYQDQLKRAINLVVSVGFLELALRNYRHSG